MGTRYFPQKTFCENILSPGQGIFTKVGLPNLRFWIFTCLFWGFWFPKTDYASVSWLISSTFFLAFVLFFIWISPKFGFEVVIHASPHRINFTFSFAPNVFRQHCNDSNLWFKSYEQFDFLFCILTINSSKSWYLSKSYEHFFFLNAFWQKCFDAVPPFDETTLRLGKFLNPDFWFFEIVNAPPGARRNCLFDRKKKSRAN